MGKHFKKKNGSILTILIIAFALVNIVSVIYISRWVIDNKANKDLENEISKAITINNNESTENTEEVTYSVDFEELRNINDDTIGWLKVKNTNIEYVVVQSNNNSYYLKHNFEKKYNNAGWIFADYKNKLDGSDKNIVIYGHNRKDNSMFGSLRNILKEEWYLNSENLTIDFITEHEQQKYQVFSVYTIENEDYYIDTDFEDNEFEEFINTLKNRSIKDFNTEVSSENSILTLSTCGNNNNYRVVLHAKRIYE